MSFEWLRPAPDPDWALDRLRSMWARLASPHWMRNPRSWMWACSDGRPQGFGVLANDQPGKANLLWLSMDLDAPPRAYDAHTNSLYVLLYREAEFSRLDGQPLADLASMLTLREFAERLPTQQEMFNRPLVGAERAYPLLKLLAERRLAHADT